MECVELHCAVTNPDLFDFFSDFHKSVMGFRPRTMWTEEEVNEFIVVNSTPEAIARQDAEELETKRWLEEMQAEEMAAAEQYRKDTEALGYPGEKYEWLDPVAA